MALASRSCASSVGARSTPARAQAVVAASPARRTPTTQLASTSPACAAVGPVRALAAPEGPSAKYLRLLRFAEENSVGSAAAPLAAAAAASSAPWAASYDEEAEDGCELSEPELVPGCSGRMAATVAAPVPVSPAGAAAAASSSSHNSVYDSAYWRGRLAATVSEAAAAASSSGRGAAAASARRGPIAVARRAALPARFGDLEAMSPWTDPALLAAAAEAQQQAARGTVGARERYASIVAFIERSAVGPLSSTVAALASFRDADLAMQPRQVQNWTLTFDEDVHGEAASGVLGSC